MNQSASGMREEVVPGHFLFTPAWQECVCGAKEDDYNDGFTRRYYSCCSLTYLDNHLVGVGQVWLTGAMRPRSRPTAARIRAILADCKPPPPGMTTALYRRLDAASVLLYVGISDDLPARSRWHERYSPWAQFVSARTTDWFPSRADAEAAETRAIKAELPLFNKQHAMPGQVEAAAQYLLQDQRIRLVRSGSQQK